LLCTRIATADENIGPKRFRPLFPKSLHKRSVNSRVYSLQNCSFDCCFLWPWNLVPHTEGGI
jgi:hypothetical protein